MADFKKIEWGLHAYLEADATLIALLGTFETKPAIFDSPAPPGYELMVDGVEQPYICLYSLDIQAADTHDTRQDNAFFQINVHTFKYSTAYDVYSVLDDLLHRQTFPIMNYTNMAVLRVRGVSKLPYEENEEVVGLSADYKIMVQE